MGNGAGAKKAQRQLDTQYTDTSNRYNDYFQTQRRNIDAAKNKADTSYNDIYGRTSGMLNDPNSFGRSYFKNFAESPTGGIDPSRVSNLEGDASKYRNFAAGNDETGGYYRSLMGSGGFSEGDKTNFRNASTAVIPGIYQGLARELESGNRATGGMNPGFTASMEKLAREQAYAGQDAATRGEVDLSNMIRAGKNTGAEGLSSHFLTGTAGAGGIDKYLIDAIQQGKQFGASGVAGADTARGGLLNTLRGLRTDVPGELSMYERQLLQSMGMNDDAINSLLQKNLSYNPKTSFWEKLKILGGMASSGLAAGMSGGGGGGGWQAAGSLPTGSV